MKVKPDRPLFQVKNNEEHSCLQCDIAMKRLREHRTLEEVTEGFAYFFAEGGMFTALYPAETPDDADYKLLLVEQYDREDS